MCDVLNDDRQSDNARSLPLQLQDARKGRGASPPHSPLPLPQPLLVLAFMLISGSATNCSRIAIFYDSLHRTIFTTWPHLAN